MLFEREELQFLEICPCNIKAQRSTKLRLGVFKETVYPVYIAICLSVSRHVYTRGVFWGAVIIGTEKSHYGFIYIYSKIVKDICAVKKLHF